MWQLMQRQEVLVGAGHLPGSGQPHPPSVQTLGGTYELSCGSGAVGEGAVGEGAVDWRRIITPQRHCYRDRYPARPALIEGEACFIALSPAATIPTPRFILRWSLAQRWRQFGSRRAP